MSCAGIADSNPAGSMDLAVLSVMCCQVEVTAMVRSLVQRRSIGSGVRFINLENEVALARVGLLRHKKKSKF